MCMHDTAYVISCNLILCVNCHIFIEVVMVITVLVRQSKATLTVCIHFSNLCHLKHTWTLLLLCITLDAD